MSNVTAARIDAEQGLRRALEASLGHDMTGVLTFGMRWDPQTKQELLRVVVDGASAAASVLRARLPRNIGGLNVKISLAGTVEL